MIVDKPAGPNFDHLRCCLRARSFVFFINSIVDISINKSRNEVEATGKGSVFKAQVETFLETMMCLRFCVRGRVELMIIEDPPQKKDGE